MAVMLVAAPPRFAADAPPDKPPPESSGPASPAPASPDAATPAPASPAPEGAAPAPPPTAPAEPGRKLAGRIRGTVMDALKQPQPGLLVTLSSHVEPDMLRVTGTNEKGQYLFQELPPGVYDLQVLSEEFQDAGKASIEVRPPFQNIVDVALRARPSSAASQDGPASAGGAAAGEETKELPPVTVRGRFIDQDRRPLVEVSVVLSSLQGKGIYQAFSGDEGRFEVPGVPPGRYRVIVRSPGHVPLDLRSVEILGRTGLTVSLMLVDYPLNFKAGQDSTPIEEPREAPPPSAAVPPAPDGGGPAAAPDDPPAAAPGG
jgi:hypothetical protein